MEPRTHETTAERRRFGKIVHDERGNGSVKWHDVGAKKGFERDTLTVEGAPLSIEQKVDTFNPYERTPTEKPPDKKPVKRDLRKLSEWIKTMRAVEEKKKSGDE
jgi:hypothetical protein